MAMSFWMLCEDERQRHVGEKSIKAVHPLFDISLNYAGLNVKKGDEVTKNNCLFLINKILLKNKVQNTLIHIQSGHIKERDKLNYGIYTSNRNEH